MELFGNSLWIVYFTLIPLLVSFVPTLGEQTSELDTMNEAIAVSNSDSIPARESKKDLLDRSVSKELDFRPTLSTKRAKKKKNRKGRKKSRKRQRKRSRGKANQVSSTTSGTDMTVRTVVHQSKEVQSDSNPMYPFMPNWVPTQNGEGCGECIWQDCQPVDVMKRHCPSGVVRDPCNCCVECASGVGMPCYISSVAPIWLPPCGDDLECVPVSEEHIDELDVASWGGRPALEGQCSCIDKVPVCASNNITYDNICEFRESAARWSFNSDMTLVSIHPGPCNTVPRINSGPEDVEAKVGEVVSFRCEAFGFPLPRIQWFKRISEAAEDFDYSFDILRYTGGDSTDLELPGYLTHAVTQMRGGPAKYQITTWLTLDKVKAADEGVYSCRASNSHGSSDGVISLKIA